MSSTLYNHCKPTNTARQIAKWACYMVQLVSQGAIATQVARKISTCNANSTFAIIAGIFLTIAGCSLRLQRVTCLLQWIFPSLRDKLQGKLHRGRLPLLIVNYVLVPH